MAFILHLIDCPTAGTSDDALAFIDGERDKAPANNPKFAAFVADITKQYPDLSESDLDGDDENNLWEEGLDGEASYGNVKELVVSVDVVDEASVTAIAQAASQHGLRLYDEEGEYLHPV